MDDHFGIGFTFKVVAYTGQFLTKLQVVFDDTVMHNGKSSIIAGVGMGVGFCRRTVSGPAGVTNTSHAGQELSILCFFSQTGDSSGDFTHQNVFIMDNRNSGGVISPVLQLF